ncbi:DUF2723 domain-containing protein [bacterium]|nr:DUF2723 domain-containing protein [bacterium]
MYSREYYIGAAVAFLFVMLILTLTMAPTVTFWDAGEFLAASYTLGIPHPPGTPLFVVLGRTISVLPLPFSVAERLNFLSVICGSVCAMLLYLVAVKVLQNMVEDSRSAAGRLVVHGGGLAAAFITPFLFSVWTNCTEAEVYAIATATMLLVGWLMTYMGSLTDQRHVKNVLLLVIYIVSLSIANHLIVLLIAPAVVVYTLLHDRDQRSYWLSVLGCFAGLYLLVMKGLDLNAVAQHLNQKTSGGTGIFVSIYLHLAALLGVLGGFYNFVESWPTLFLGAMLLAGCLFWAVRERSLNFFLTALGLFLLGFSIHLYLLIRSGLLPPINEGQPDNLAALWAVIGREQYGSAYGILPRQVWSMITGKDAVSSASDLIGNIGVYFKYNIPFYFKYFGWQFGNTAVSTVFILLGVYGAYEHWRHERKSFWFWLTTFLVTGLILNTYMNFKLGYTQAQGAYPNQDMHEVRERDYFFMVSYAFFGLWCGLGLAGIVNRLRLAFRVDSAKPILARPVFLLLGLLFLAPAFVPLYANWSKSSRADNYVPPVYARNIMNSMEPNGILFTNGDNDTFPLWYIQEVEGVRKDCRVVNLSLLNTDWYIRQMRNQEPKVPISYTEQQIMGLRPFLLDKEMKFKFGEVELTFAKNSVMYVKDIMILDILRTNKWQKPVYFTTTVPPSNRAGLDPYLTMVGSLYKVNPVRSETLAASDSNLAPLGENGICLDIEGTRHLIYDVYKYDSFFRESESREDADIRLVEHFAAPFAYLGSVYLQHGQAEKAMEANLRARSFMQERHRWDFALASLYCRAGQYDNALAMLDSFATAQGQNLPVWYTQTAQLAMNNGAFDQAARFVEKSLELDPHYRDGYASLFVIHKQSGDKEKAAQVLERFIKSFPDETARVTPLLEAYRATGQIDLNTAFGVTAR